MGGGGDGGADAAPTVVWLGAVTPATLSYAKSYGKMVALARAPGFVTANIGDAAAYLASDAEAPTRDDELASLYYETEGLADAVERGNDSRPGIEDREAGARVAATVATALTVGFAADTPSGRRGSARWHGLTAARALDYYFLVAVWRGLNERSAEGYDRAWATLWNAQERAHGLGSLLAAADATCGTDVLARLEAALGRGRVVLEEALATEGQSELDPLDRRVLIEGRVPEYEAVAPEVVGLVVEGLGLALVALLEGAVDANVQAEALAAYGALSPSLGLVDGGVAGMVSAALDAADPGAVESEVVREALVDSLGLPSCTSALIE